MQRRDNGFQLTPPEVITPVSEQAARTAVPMAPELKARLDSAFALGREEVSVASSLMQGRLLQRNFVGMEDTTAFKAI